jgi:Fe-S-cluster containining protein
LPRTGHQHLDVTGSGTPSRADDAGFLCQQCALCCDGSLFEAVVLTDDEARAEIWGGRFIARLGDRPPKAKQRCPHLDATSCGVYAARPFTCRAYECRLFGAVAAGDIDLAEALGRVAAMRSLIAKITCRLAKPPSTTAFVSRLKAAANHELEYTDGDRTVGDNTVVGMLDAMDEYRSQRELFLPAG